MPYSRTIIRSFPGFRALTLGTAGLVGVGSATLVASAQAPSPPATSAGTPAEAAPVPNAPPAPIATPVAPPDATQGELNVRIGDEQGAISVDGREVGQGSYRGALSAGRHQLRVTRTGYETYEAWIEIEPGQVRSESVSLRQSVNPVPPSRGHAPTSSLDGIYGGIHLLGVFQPTGTGSTFEDACDTIGATSCTSPAPLGAGVGGHIGWAFDPLGLELGLFATAQVDEPVASFDGVNGSEINPVVASPARDEKFTIGRFGGGAALRGRLWLPLSGIRLTIAAGPGLSYRSIAWRRETSTADGFSDTTAESGIDYLSPLLSIEAGAQLLLGRSLGLAFGVTTWFETASDNAKSTPSTDTVLYKDNRTPPLPLATPSYDLANGTQWYLGPYLGLSFGP